MWPYFLAQWHSNAIIRGRHMMTFQRSAGVFIMDAYVSHPKVWAKESPWMDFTFSKLTFSPLSPLGPRDPCSPGGPWWEGGGGGGVSKFRSRLGRKRGCSSRSLKCGRYVRSGFHILRPRPAGKRAALTLKKELLSRKRAEFVWKRRKLSKKSQCKNKQKNRIKKTNGVPSGHLVLLVLQPVQEKKRKKIRERCQLCLFFEANTALEGRSEHAIPLFMRFSFHFPNVVAQSDLVAVQVCMCVCVGGYLFFFFPSQHACYLLISSGKAF